MCVWWSEPCRRTTVDSGVRESLVSSSSSSASVVREADVLIACGSM